MIAHSSFWRRIRRIVAAKIHFFSNIQHFKQKNMKFYCETYHEERDTEHCVFCSAACNQRPLVKNTKETEELLQDKEKKIGVYDVTMIDFHEDSITKKDLLNKLKEALEFC